MRTVLGIDHGFERHHFDANFFLMLRQKRLGIERPVKGLSLAVLARAGVIAADNHVSTAIIPANDGMPQGFARTAHPHGQGQEAQRRRLLRVAL